MKSSTEYVHLEFAQSYMQRLAPMNNLQYHLRTDFSRSVSVSVLDERLSDSPIMINHDKPIEMFLPRDPKLTVPPMIFHNVTSFGDNQIFHFHRVSFDHLSTNENFPFSSHLEVHPLNTSVSYFFVYKFDAPSRFENIINEIDGRKVFCAQSKFSA